MVQRLGRVGWVVLLVLLLGTVVLTTLRLLQLDAGLAVQAVAFTPLALPAYVVLLAVLLVVARRRAPGRRVVPLVAALVAAVGLGLHAWWISPSYLGDAPAPAAGAQPLVVMTSNLYEGKGDITEVVDAVRREHVDVLVLEEISMPALAEADAAGLGDLLPHRIGGPAGYDPVSGTMVLSTLPLGTPTRIDTFHDSWLVDVGDSLTVMGVHPVAPVTPGLWRTDQAAILTAARQAQPDVVLGDFNATADHQPIQALDAAGFRDAAALADEGWQPTWPAHGLGPGGRLVPPLVRIDHVLVGPAWTALETHTVDIADSDHLALVATVAPR